jgi:anthranilate synthase component 2
MIVLIDNYDSFSYNLVQLIGGYESDIRVIRNDACTCEEIREMHPDHIVLSPGPGRPQDAGICEEAIRYFQGKVPLLGVCLGHQAICEAYGATITYAAQLYHGKQSKARVDTNCRLFAGLDPEILVARYHSLAVDQKTLPEELQVVAATGDGEVMAVAHKHFPTFGLQFHPESIMTPEGDRMIRNFLSIGK